MNTQSRGLPKTGRLIKRDLDPNPISQFARWFESAQSVGEPAPDVMVLATAGKVGIPSARLVVLRGFDQDGFCFYTNYKSLKGEQLAENPHAALVFYWQKQNRQVRISGQVSKISKEESDTYFQTRPVDSQLSAWVSRQSQKIANLEVLENKRKRYKVKFGKDNIPRPHFWGGYQVFPNRLEFWQSAPNRLHDRFQYTLQSGGIWVIDRLAP